VFLTPLLTLWLAGTNVDVPAGKMLLSILYMVILPVSAGLLLNTLLPSTIRRLQPCLPLIAVAAIVLIIAIITALNADALATLGAAVLLAVFLHNLTGLFAGYTMARLLGYPVAERRTLAIEVGMQNSGLAVALAMKHFSASAALPGAIFSIWHNLSGSVLAYFWAKRAKKA
ncbi:MAG TPA: bile acid:sodium symporter family protein, partial [Gammaproteobacteria bacterium]|nr:bile acid:sodium symporter family protein [Gammaproteobacteria bacterium]